MEEQDARERIFEPRWYLLRINVPDMVAESVTGPQTGNDGVADGGDGCQAHDGVVSAEEPVDEESRVETHADENEH